MRVAKFLVSGCIGISVNLGTLHLLVLGGLHYLSASVIAVSCSTVVGFLLQKLWTFQSRSLERSGTQFALYAGLAVINIGINTLIVFTLVSGLGVYYLFAQAIGAATIAVLSYFAYTLYIFNPGL